MPAHGRTYRFGEFTLDVPGRRLSRRDRTVRLEPRPLDLLALLVERRGALVRRDEIDAHFWSGAPVEVSAAINTLVRKVRRALGDNAASPRFIETVHAEGYRFIGAVEVVTTPDAPPRGRESAGELASLPEVPLSAPAPAPATVRQPSGWRPTVSAVAFGSLALAATTVAVATPAVGVAAVLYGMFLALLLAGDEPATRLGRGAVSLVLYLGMAYVPSAWTLFQLSGEMVNFDALRPAALYPVVTGMRFLPLFAVVLAYWTAAATPAESPASPLSRRAYWGTCALFVSLTVVGLATYGGEPAIWRSRIPGWKLLASGYALVLLINLAVAQAAIAILDGNPAPRRRGVLSSCALAYVALLAPAIAIGAEYNAINRHHLSERRTQAYRASNPQAVLGPDRQRLLGRDDVGADLRALFEDSQFAQALTSGRFYKVDLDERFQLLKRAVVFGYEEFDRAGSRGFKLVRLPEPIARAIAFRPAGD